MPVGFDVGVKLELFPSSICLGVQESERRRRKVQSLVSRCVGFIWAP